MEEQSKINDIRTLSISEILQNDFTQEEIFNEIEIRKKARQKLHDKVERN